MKSKPIWANTIGARHSSTAGFNSGKINPGS